MREQRRTYHKEFKTEAVELCFAFIWNIIGEICAICGLYFTEYCDYREILKQVQDDGVMMSFVKGFWEILSSN